MKEFLIYLIKSGLCLGIFMLVYRLLMSSTTFFKLNRAFLITGLVLSFAIPTINYTYDVVEVLPQTITPVDQRLLRETPTLSKVSQVEVDYSASQPKVTKKAESIVMIRLDSVWRILFIIYVTVVTLLIIRDFIVHGRLIGVVRKGKKLKYDGHTVIDTTMASTPFAAFNVVFADMSRISGDKAKASILKHEAVHVTQRHWIDLILAEVALILQWFNPVMWGYVRNLKINHEYLADKGVLDQGVSLTEYQQVLINERMQGDVFNISNSFKGGQSLGRLAMMKKERSAKWKKALLLAIFPLLGAFLWVSAEPNYILLNFDKLSIEVVGNVDTVDENGYPVKNGISTKDLLLLGHLPSYENLIPSSLRSKKTDLYSRLGTNGTLVIETRKNSRGVKNIDLIEEIRGLEDVIILINGSAATFEDLEALPKEDIASLVYMIDNKMISQTGNLLTVSLISGYGVSGPKLLKTDDIKIALTDLNKILNELDKPLIVINGRKSSAEVFKKVKMNAINVMSILTKPENTRKYGEKSKGGIITITTTDIPS